MSGNTVSNKNNKDQPQLPQLKVKWNALDGFISIIFLIAVLV